MDRLLMDDMYWLMCDDEVLEGVNQAYQEQIEQELKKQNAGKEEE